MNKQTNFFLGANSENGFVSYFKQLQEQSDSMQLLILKGGPGSGKSSLMKRVASFAKEKGHILEMIPCASDIDSYDGFIDKTAAFCMIDGTSPHTEDPLLPGALHHILYTGDLWDTSLLKENSIKIKLLTERIADYHKSAGVYIKAAGALLKENILYSKKHLHFDDAESLCEKICKKIPSGKSFSERNCLLSAVTGGQIKYFNETVLSLADKVYVLDDSWGGASSCILKSIRERLKMKGTDFIHCPCSIMPDKTDHIIIPSIKTAVITQNSFLPSSFGEKILCDKFYRPMRDVNLILRRTENARTLLKDACTLVKEAKLLHDKLEHIYVDAMDFSSMNAVFETITEKFYK